MPKYLFRFRSLRGDAKDYVRQSILKNEIYFAPPVALNDPYDCQIAMSTDGSEQGWRTYFKHTMKHSALREGKRSRFMDRHATATRWVRERRHERIDAKALGSITGSFGIACFSGLLDNQLMWSHYADNHRGICLVYEPDRDSSGLLSSHHELRYSAEYPYLRLVDLPFIGPEAVERLLLTKSLDWAYEAEFRLIKPYGAATTAGYDPAALVAVVLGARISAPDEQHVIQWTKQHCSRPLIHRAELRIGKFGVMIDPEKSL